MLPRFAVTVLFLASFVVAVLCAYVGVIMHSAPIQWAAIVLCASAVTGILCNLLREA